jgi:hypothetical protein
MWTLGSLINYPSLVAPVTAARSPGANRAGGARSSAARGITMRWEANRRSGIFGCGFVARRRAAEPREGDMLRCLFGFFVFAFLIPAVADAQAPTRFADAHEPASGVDGPSVELSQDYPDASRPPRP